jgi:hypothetical protein
MPWTVFWNPMNGGFSISGSSPGPVTDEAFMRQERVNTRLRSKVFATFALADD